MSKPASLRHASATKKPRGAPLRHERRTIDCPETFRIVAVADTHSSPHAEVATRIQEQAPLFILHGGDIGDLGVIDELGAIAPVHVVRGNIDDKVSGIPDVLTLSLASGPRTLLTILLVHIAVYGPKLRGEIKGLAKREQADIVVCGHSHVPFLGRDDGIVVFNPGSIGPRRFSLPIALGVIEFGKTQVSLRHIDCETGQLWLPGPSR